MFKMKQFFLKFIFYRQFVCGLFLILIFINSGFSQKDTSLQQFQQIALKYIDISEANINSNKQFAEKIAKEALYFSFRSRNDSVSSINYYLLSRIYKGKYENSNAIEALNNAIFYALVNSDYLNALQMIIDLGETHRALGNYDIGIYYLKIADYYCNNKQNLILKAKIYNRMSAIYYEMENFQKSIYFAEKSLNLCRSVSESRLEADNQILIGSSLNYLKKYHQALTYLFKAETIFKKESPQDLPYVLNNICFTFLNMGDYNKAEFYGLLSYNIAIKDSIKPYIYLSSKYLLSTYEKKKDFYNAYKFLSIMTFWADIISSSMERQRVLDGTNRLNEIRVKSEIENYQKTIFQDAKIKELNLLIIILLASIVVFVISAMIVFIQKTKKLKTQNNKLIELNEKITQQKNEILQKVEELRIANASKNKFFSIIAHDIRAPFHSILGLTDILQQDYSILSDNERVEIINMLNTSSNNIFKLLDNLLKWSQSQTGNIQFKPEKIELKPLIESVVELMQQNALSKNIKLAFYYTEELQISADKNMIDTVLRNFISNAIKFTKPNGSIDVILVRNSNKAKVVVKDSGVGISEEDLSKIFSIDMKNVSIGTDGETGSGLGLLLCKEFVEKNNGILQVESKENEGSSFAFLIPVVE